MFATTSAVALVSSARNSSEAPKLATGVPVVIASTCSDVIAALVTALEATTVSVVGGALVPMPRRLLVLSQKKLPSADSVDTPVKNAAWPVSGDPLTLTPAAVSQSFHVEFSWQRNLLVVVL